jgi:hypothetical protein
LIGENSTQHGQANSPEYVSWRAMKARVSDPNNKDWKYYGGRGLTVCAEWLSSFSTFLHDMGPRPQGTTLDRIDPNGNYEPGNCRWADALTQSRNRRSTKGWKKCHS